MCQLLHRRRIRFDLIGICSSSALLRRDGGSILDAYQLSLMDSEMRSNNSKNAVSLSLHLDGRLREGLAFDIGLFLPK